MKQQNQSPPPSLIAVTVKPALVLPKPVVMTDRLLNLAANFRNCDFPVPLILTKSVKRISGTEADSYRQNTNTCSRFLVAMKLQRGIPGSPTRRRWDSPRTFVPEPSICCTPPISVNAT